MLGKYEKTSSLLLLELVLVPVGRARETVHVRDGTLSAVGFGNSGTQVDGYPDVGNGKTIVTLQVPFMIKLTTVIEIINNTYTNYNPHCLQIKGTTKVTLY